MLLILGKFDPGLTLRWVYRAFSKMPKPTRKMIDFLTFESPQDGEHSVTVGCKCDVQVVTVSLQNSERMAYRHRYTALRRHDSGEYD